MANYTDETIKIFVDESLEHLADIENELLAIEQGGADIDENLVNKVYRAAHSIKGGAGFMGLSNIKNLTHEMENILGRIRAREMVPEPAVIDALLKAADTLRNLINDIENSNDADISRRMAALECISGDETDTAECIERDPRPVTTGINLSLPGDDRQLTVPKEDIDNIRKEGKYLYLISLSGIQRPALLPMIRDMNRCGTVLVSRPELPSAEGGEPVGTAETLSFQILFATVLRPSDLDALLDSENATIYTVNEDHAVRPADMAAAAPEETPAPPEPVQAPEPAVAVRASERAAPPPEAQTEPIPEPVDAPIAAEPAAEAPRPSGPKPRPDRKKAKADDARTEAAIEPVAVQTSLRVNIKLLDLLMTLAGELVLSRNQLLQAIIRHDRRALEISGQRIDLITSELQEAIMHTRMQPIQNIFNKFPRVVRDLANTLGKRIELTIEGKEVELDKSIIENLNDPMTHLIRNAADHGLEAPEERIEAGKDPVGRMHLKAYHEAGQVNIEIRDDGRGIDGERIAASAIEKGLVSEERVAGMSPGDKVNLIFLPGFSMSENITDLSGRGVGMDVVKTNLDNMGGLVDIDSEPGEGTAIHIKLPLTLAIIPSLLVSNGNERYAIPQVNVVELIRIQPSRIEKRIEWIGDARVIRLRDELLPLMRLSDILETPEDRDDGGTPAENRGLNIVVVHTGIFKYGLIVDHLHDSEEIVVKPLGRHLKDCQGYAGATILGDGRVALILDVPDLARMADLATLSGAARNAEAAEKTVPPEEEPQTLLLFRNSEKTRFAIPLELVERIDRIRCEEIEIAGGRRVIRRGDISMPLFDIGDVASVEAFENGEKALVIVFFVAGMDVGILAIPPIDTVKTAFRVDETALKQPGIAGSAVIDGKTTLMVDIIGIIESLRPEWFTVESRSGSRTDDGKTIILAEDSRFFRNQMKCAIEDAGYHVIEAADGRIAWDLLEKNADLVSLVVTDLEMPNLDGFGFARQIKGDDRFSHLPVVAVSSLAGKEDIKKAEESGVDEYQVKLDRKKLVECLNHYLEGP